MTAAAGAIVLGLTSASGPLSHTAAPGFVLMVIGAFTPLLAWRLHRRHVDRSAVGGALLGYLAGAVLTLLLLGLDALVMLALSAVGLSAPRYDAGQVAGLIAVAVIVAVFLTVAAWLDVDALRDLSAKRREHVWLDVARLAATVTGVAYLVVVAVWATGSSGFDYIGAILFLGGAGVVGAAVVTVADLMVARHEQRTHGHLISGV